MKKSYTAKATIKNGEKTFDICIYSNYKTIEEANEGVKRFCEKGYNVVKTWVE